MSLEVVRATVGAYAATSPATPHPKILVENATKRYQTRSGNVHALEDVSAAFPEGEFTCIVGPSGCGKSTLLWSMAGLHQLTSGEIRLDGQLITGPNRQIGMIFQEANLLPWRSLRANIELPLEIKGVSRRAAAGRIEQLLARVGLTDFQRKFPRELSGGMQQRASIVRSLSFDPSVLLMDEPFGALDAFTRDEMNLLIQEIWMETRKTIVFVTHSIAEAVFLADRILVMSPRPGRLSRVFDVDLQRPRTIDIMTEPHFLKRMVEVRASIEHRT